MTRQDINNLWTKYEDEAPDPETEVLVLDKWGDIIDDYYYGDEYAFMNTTEDEVLAWVYIKTLRPDYEYIRKVKRI